MRRMPRQLALAAFMPMLFITSVCAQMHPIEAVDPSDGGSMPAGNLATEDAAVGLASAFLSTYSPTLGNVVRDTGSWKATSVGDTWKVYAPSGGTVGGSFVVTIDKADGRILDAVEER